MEWDVSNFTTGKKWICLGCGDVAASGGSIWVKMKRSGQRFGGGGDCVQQALGGGARGVEGEGGGPVLDQDAAKVVDDGAAGGIVGGGREVEIRQAFHEVRQSC